MKKKNHLLYDSAKYFGLWNAVMTPTKMKHVILTQKHSVHVFPTIKSVVEFTDQVREGHPTIRPTGTNWHHVEYEGAYQMYQWLDTELYLVLYTEMQYHRVHRGSYVGWGMYGFNL